MGVSQNLLPCLWEDKLYLINQTQVQHGTLLDRLPLEVPKQSQSMGCGALPVIMALLLCYQGCNAQAIKIYLTYCTRVEHGLGDKRGS